MERMNAEGLHSSGAAANKNKNAARLGAGQSIGGGKSGGCC